MKTRTPSRRAARTCSARVQSSYAPKDTANQPGWDLRYRPASDYLLGQPDAVTVDEGVLREVEQQHRLGTARLGAAVGRALIGGGLWQDVLALEILSPWRCRLA